MTTKRIIVTVPDDLYDEIEEEMRRSLVSTVSEAVRVLIKRGLKTTNDNKEMQE